MLFPADVPLPRPSRWTAPAVATALVIGSAVPADAIVWRDDLTDAQTQGLAQQGQFGGSGYVRTAGSIGTGVAIAPGWVLTARHFTGNGLAASFELNGTRYTGTTISTGDSDVALIRLDGDQQLPASTVFIAPNPGGAALDPVGQLIWKVGGGESSSVADSQTSRGPSGVALRAGSNVIDSRRTFTFGSGALQSTGPLLVFNQSNQAANSTAFEVTTAPGDSGGGLFFQQGNQWYVGGVQTGVIGGVGFLDADVAARFDWIQETTGLTFAPQAAPTELVWDGDFSTAGVQTGPGIWSTDRPNFTDPGGSGFNYTWENDVAPTAVFGTAGTSASVVRLDDNLTVGGIRFAPLASGSGPYQITDGGGRLTAATGGATLDAQTFARLNTTLAGSNDFTKTGTADLIIDGDNAGFGGELFINQGAAIFTDGASFGVGGFNANTRTTVADGATLQFRGLGLTSGELIRLSGDGANGRGALYISRGDHRQSESVALLADATLTADAGTSLTLSGPRGSFFNPRVLTKNGAGTLVLETINNIAGVRVDGGTLAGAGGVNGFVTVGSGADLRPGDTANAAAFGDFATDDFTLERAASLTIDLDPLAGLGDVVDVTGAIDLAGDLALNLLSVPTLGAVYVIATNDGQDTVSGAFANAATVAATFGGNRFDFDVLQDAGSGNDIGLTLRAIPEPASAAMLLIGGALLVRRRPRG